MHRNFAAAIIFGLLFSCALFVTALAEEDLLLTSEQQSEIIEGFSEHLLEHYVLPEKAELLIDALHQAQARNEYSSSKTMGAFLAQTNELIQKTANDKHLRLLSPEKFNQMMVMFYGDDSEDDEGKPGEHAQAEPGEANPAGHAPPEPANHGSGHGDDNGGAPVNGHGGGQDDAHSNAGRAQAEDSKSKNPLSVVGVSNVSEISRDGLNQTGYLALERFDGSARSVAFMERVFGTFTESDNIIIDLRNCGGGDAEMVKVLSSYFFAEPTHLLNTIMPDESNEARIVERWTEPNRLSPYFADKPLTILISEKTFSAAESFSFGMQATARAELVGETTGGGGYINDFYPLPYELGASISVGRTYDPRTGKDWQGIGVIPEVQVEQDHALITALTSFTEKSGKLDQLKGEELKIYQQIQNYTNAWYGADHETMSGLLADEFIALYSDPSGAVVEKISSEQLIADTENGKGSKENEIYYNRIIRDIDVADGQASVLLILRESIHHMSLTKKDGEWLISHDEFNDKRRGPA